MAEEVEQKFYVRLKIFDIQQKKEFIQEMEVMAKDEEEAKFLVFYGARKVWPSDIYRFAIASIRGGLILPS